MEKDNVVGLYQKYATELEFIMKYIEIPDEYNLKIVENGKHNSENILIFRFEKLNSKNISLEGEHFSIVLEVNKFKILGFTCMDKKFENNEKYISKEDVIKQAEIFLEKLEPGLFKKAKNLWIESHDEIIIVNGEKIIISGMKYKCYVESTDSYLWIIFGRNGEVITFERDIIWKSGRVTEKWLHDTWLKDLYEKI